METKIRNWLDIAGDFRDTLVLGNGASIAIHDDFGYGSLIQKARDDGLITGGPDALFKKMQTDDFELVLHRLSIAEFVNKALGISDGKTHDAYEKVRDALGATVQQIHPEHATVKTHFEAAYAFMKGFTTVLSLNYDVLVYWAMMLGNSKLGNHFKDCFADPDGHFTNDWKPLRTAHNADGTTLVFYPHGNLVLVSQGDGTESKIKCGTGDSAPLLLDQIIKNWKEDLYTPLFVAEGDSQQKVKAIRRSRYLSVVYDEVLPSLDGTVAIYGWSLDDKDKHILEKLCKGKKKIAISVHEDGVGDVTSRCSQIDERIGMVDANIEVVFYRAESNGCWTNTSPIAEEPNIPETVPI